MIVGIDEAGRGPLVGNVVACACFLPLNPPFIPKDSKKLSPVQREKMFSWLEQNAVYGLGQASAQEIDEVNILNATFLAFERAIDALIQKKDELKSAKFIIDGNRFKTKKIEYPRISVGFRKFSDSNVGLFKYSSLCEMRCTWGLC